MNSRLPKSATKEFREGWDRTFAKPYCLSCGNTGLIKRSDYVMDVCQNCKAKSFAHIPLGEPKTKYNCWDCCDKGIVTVLTHGGYYRDKPCRCVGDRVED